MTTYFANPFAAKQPRRSRVSVWYDNRDVVYYAAVEDVRERVWYVYAISPQPEYLNALETKTKTILRRDVRGGRRISLEDTPPAVRAAIETHVRRHSR